MPTHFTPAALKFLRGLARNNDREWFEARRNVYELELKAPMHALIEEVNESLVRIAPDHIRPANKAMKRIYRDTRFSNDKRPYKHHVGAAWGKRGMEKTSATFYTHIAPKEVVVFAGVWMPEREELLAIRRWMAEHHEEFRALQKRVLKPRKNESAALLPVDAQSLTRMPKGFAADHPADELLRARNWGVELTLPGEAALEPTLHAEIVAIFKRAAPLVSLLNEAIEQGATKPKKPMFGFDF